MISALPSTTATKINNICHQKRITKVKSSIMPMEMKNSPINRSRNGRISASSWRRYWLSPSSMPAINAPNAIDKPSHWVNAPVTKATTSVDNTKSSLERERATSSKIRGKAHLPKAIKRKKAKIPLSKAKAISASIKGSPPLASNGNRINSGTTAKSWNNKTLTDSSP